LGIGSIGGVSDPVALSFTGSSMQGKNPSQIELGTNITVILANDGTVHAFGENTDGALGDGTFIHRSLSVDTGLVGISMIAVKHKHVLAFNTTHLLSWGNNAFVEASFKICCLNLLD